MSNGQDRNPPPDRPRADRPYPGRAGRPTGAFRVKRIVLVTLGALCIATSPLSAQTQPTGTASPGPIVVELFTSQGCSSCPPAEAYLGDLAARPDIIALEWHVDYWDTLVHGLAGRWKDPFSDPSFTDRQTRYNLAIRDRARIYTPQMVIDGRWEAVGSRIAAVQRRLDEAGSRPRSASIDMESAPDGTVTATLDGWAADTTGSEPASVWLVRFRDREATTVEGGENNGRVLVNHHVVTGIDRLGTWDGGAATYEIPPGPC